MRTSAGLAAALAVCLVAPAQGVADSCDGATDVIVTEDDLAAGERTLLCMLNVHRAGVGQSLRMDTTLLFAARSHSSDMVARNYFDHSGPEGVTPRQRATDAGYPEGFAVGEVIARSADDPTPAVLFAQVTADPAAAELVRRPGFATTGVGLALGTPGGPGVTLTVMVGVADTDAEDTAVDLLTRTDCEPLTARLQTADARFAKRDRAVAKLERAVERLEAGGSAGELEAAKRKLKRKRKIRDKAGKALELTYAAAEAACNPKKFHTNPK